MITGNGQSAFRLAAAMLVVAGLGLTINQTNGLPELRFGRDADAAAIFALVDASQDELQKWLNPKTTVPCFQLPPPYDTPKADFFLRSGCLQRRAGKPGVLLTGDSHSASLGVGLRQWAKLNDIDFLQVSSGGPDSGLFYEAKDRCNAQPSCDPDYVHALKQTIKQSRPDILVVDLYWSQSNPPVGFRNIEDWITYIQGKVAALARDLAVKKVVIIGQIPTWEDDLPKFLLRNYVNEHKAIPERTFAGIQVTSLQMDASMRKAKWPPNWAYFSMKDVLCNENGCLTRVGENLKTDLIVWDYGHMTEAGSTYVAEHGLGDFIMQTLKGI